MSFLKEEHKKSGTYLTIVESYRDSKGSNRHKRLYSLGKKEDYSGDMLQRIGQRLYLLGGGKIEDLLSDITQEIGRYNYGYPILVKKLLTWYNFPRYLHRIEKKHRLKINLFETLELLICDRLHDPQSKLGTYNFQKDYIGLSDIPLQHIYRTLDYLSEHTDLIQQLIYQRNITLFNYELDVVFYDVTTLYFDSEKEIEGSLRQKGFSKDGKIGQTQIVFGLLVDKNKLPIAYKIYKGNMYEGHTFEDFVKALKKEYSIKEIVIVSDRGMMNKSNISLFDDNKQNGCSYYYIIGERLKNLPEIVGQRLIDKNNYKEEILISEEGERIPIKYCLINYEGKTLLGTYSESRAIKDKSDREKILCKSEMLKNRPKEIEKKASRYFLKKVGKSGYELDKEKIEKAEKYDGFLVIATDKKDLLPSEILSSYKDLYKIEQSFRTFKSYLQTRPIFHWTDKRIEGHLCMCYISFCFLQNVLLTMKQKECAITENILRRMLDKMQVSHLQQGKNELYLRSYMDECTKSLVKNLNLPLLPDLISKDNLSNLL